MKYCPLAAQVLDLSYWGPSATKKESYTTRKDECFRLLLLRFQRERESQPGRHHWGQGSEEVNPPHASLFAPWENPAAPRGGGERQQRRKTRTSSSQTSGAVAGFASATAKRSLPPDPANIYLLVPPSGRCGQAQLNVSLRSCCPVAADSASANFRVENKKVVCALSLANVATRTLKKHLGTTVLFCYTLAGSAGADCILTPQETHFLEVAMATARTHTAAAAAMQSEAATATGRGVEGRLKGKKTDEPPGGAERRLRVARRRTCPVMAARRAELFSGGGARSARRHNFPSGQKTEPR